MYPPHLTRRRSVSIWAHLVSCRSARRSYENGGRPTRCLRETPCNAHPEARPVDKTRRHIDGISPTGGRKNIFPQIPKPTDADAVYGAIWYEDPIRSIEHHSRFILRIAPRRDIPGEGLTRLDAEGVSEEYWSWDYKKKGYLTEVACAADMLIPNSLLQMLC